MEIKDQALPVLEVKVVSVYRLPPGGRIKAFVNICIEDAILIKGIRIIDGKKGLMVSMPVELGKDEKWYERVRCLNKDIKEQINVAALKAYASSSPESDLERDRRLDGAIGFNEGGI